MPMPARHFPNPTAARSATGRGWCLLSLLLSLLLSACGGGSLGSGGGTPAGPATSAVMPVAVQFVDATPATIYLSDTPSGVSRAVLRFRVTGSLGQAATGTRVVLALVDASSGARLEGAGADGSATATSDGEGLVRVAVLAGTVPAALQVRATIEDNPALTATSNLLRVAVGRPTQSAMSLAVQTLAIEGFEVDGVETELTVSLADRLGNPVPDGTQVNLVAEAGVLVPPTCVTDEGLSRCTVRLRSQGLRPANGRVTVLAYTPGDEDFTDLNGNNRWDPGEPFTDLGLAYRDDDENGQYDPGEFFAPRDGGVACAGGPHGRRDTCDGRWGAADVRVATVVVFATQRADIGLPQPPLAAGSGSASITVRDLNGNSVPTSSALSVGVRATEGSQCVAELTSESTVDNRRGPTSAVVRYDKCVAGDEITLSVRTPRGFVTSRSYVFP